MLEARRKETTEGAQSPMEALLFQELPLLFQSKLIEPDLAIKDNETVIGEMTLLEKKLYSAACASWSKEDIIIRALKGKPLKPPRGWYLGTGLRELMWGMSRERLQAHTNIGVRVGWKIVSWWDDDE